MLERAGARFPDDVANVTVMTTNMRLLNENVDIWCKFFGEAYPALTYLQVVELSNAVAVLPAE